MLSPRGEYGTDPLALVSFPSFSIVAVFLTSHLRSRITQERQRIPLHIIRSHQQRQVKLKIQQPHLHLL